MVEYDENPARPEHAGIADDLAMQCRDCQYFRPEPWETGYCRHTHMFVLETFACDKFIRVTAADASAADALERSESPVTTRTPDEKEVMDWRVQGAGISGCPEQEGPVDEGAW